jgi:NAD(P)-dependent dehydrogenase (short-subunit alcohol dehydrogenase family)
MSTPHTGEFAGPAALVTGGASGIGLATARLLASRGARVAVLDREVPSAAAGGGSSGHTPFGSDPLDAGLRPAVADVTDDGAVRAAVAGAAQALGGLDILVNNAGIGAAGTVEDNDDAEWHHVLDVNVLGIVRTTRAALPALRASAARRGHRHSARGRRRDVGPPGPAAGASLAGHRSDDWFRHRRARHLADGQKPKARATRMASGRCGQPCAHVPRGCPARAACGQPCTPRKWTQEDRWYFADASAYSNYWIEAVDGGVILLALLLARIIGGEATAE